MDKLKEDYKLQKQHDMGKLHAIERIECLVDEGSFHEIGALISNESEAFGLEKNTLSYDGVITGYGMIAGKKVFLYSQDFTVKGGTLGNAHGKKIAAVIKMAIENRCPIIGINDSGGARIQEGVKALAGYGEIFYYNTLASGYIPQISVVAGPCAGGAVYSPGITDFIFTVDDIGYLFVTGPKVVKSVTNENVTNEELGGAGIHARKSGVSHFRCENEEDCYRKIRKLLELIPHNNATVSQITYKKDRVKEAVQSQLNYILPSKSNQAYDMQSVIELLLDTDSFLEVQKEFAPNMIIGFGRLYGECVGIVANQPNYMAGVIDSDASDKAARFIRYCDAFNIPLVTLVDVPGFMPGTSEEYKGIIRHGAKMLYAYSEATTVKLTVILRKAYGGAYIAMCSKHLRADMVYAWESAEIAVMGAEGAVEVLYSKDLKKLAGEEAVEYFSEKVEEYKQTYMNSTMAAQLGYVDAVIQPSETREELYHSIMQFQGKRSLEKVEKKHGNMPL